VHLVGFYYKNIKIRTENLLASVLYTLHVNQVFGFAHSYMNFIVHAFDLLAPEFYI